VVKSHILGGNWTGLRDKEVSLRLNFRAMPTPDFISRVEALQKEIASHGNLSPEVLRRIQYRFRLDWNYHSNSMEGNTLTREETRSIMIGNVTVHGKPVRDVLEMRGHDEVVHQILRMSKGEIRLSEKRILEIHKAIMHEEDPDKRENIGRWKQIDNHVINHRQEKFDFVPAAEVPHRMHELLNWVNAELDKIRDERKDAPHPAVLAFRFHLRYLTIHPFYDGNGRTARILLNLLLISQGYPPVIITKEEKGTYGRYLAEVQAYGTPENQYLEYMGELLVRSLETVHNAIEGRPVLDESDSIAKELHLLEIDLSRKRSLGDDIILLSPEILLEMYYGWIRDFIANYFDVLSRFTKFFSYSNQSIVIDASSPQHKSIRANFIQSLDEYIPQIKIPTTSGGPTFNLTIRPSFLFQRLNHTVGASFEYLSDVRINIKGDSYEVVRSHFQNGGYEHVRVAHGQLGDEWHPDRRKWLLQEISKELIYLIRKESGTLE
jgi:Fic family protein